MKQFFLKIALLLTLCFILDKPIGWLISEGVTNRQHDNRIELLMEGEINADLLVLGSSRASYNYRASVIEKETGLTCYNLGMPGSNIDFHYDMLELILEAEAKPKYILLNIDEPAELWSIEGYIYRKDALQPYTKYPLVNKMVCGHSEKNYYASLVSWAYRENDNFVESLSYLLSGKNPPTFTTNIRKDGSIAPLKEKAKELSYQDTSVVYDASVEVDNKVRLLKKFISTCADNDIQLFLVIPPQYKARHEGFKERIVELFGAEGKCLDYINFTKDEQYFFDYGHLNSKGSKMFSTKLGSDIKQLIQ